MAPTLSTDSFSIFTLHIHIIQTNFQKMMTSFIQGYITTKDLAKLTKKLSREEVGALMTKLDTDGDGQLSFDEFKEMLQKITSENWIGPFKNLPH